MAQPLPLTRQRKPQGQETGTPELWSIVVEQEGQSNHPLVRLLRHRMRVDVARDPVIPYVLAFEGVFDAIILHRPMEGADGSLAVCRELRRSGVTTPILMLAQRGSVDDIVGAIDAGADDVMIEPVEVELLVARVRAFQRRTAFQATPSKLCVADLVLDLQYHVVWRGHQEIDLSASEYLLLEYLMRHRGEVLSQDRIACDLRHRSDDMLRNADRIILDLQRKVDQRTRRPLIRTINGTGYVLGEGGLNR